MRARGRSVGLGWLALAALALLAPGANARPAARTINVTATDTTFRLSAKGAPVGTVTFVVRNAGKAKHDFKIAAKKTAPIAPGKTARLIVTFAKAGKFAYTSTLPGDAAKGLKGVFTLQATPAAGGNVAAGKQVFVSTGCGSCHTLKAAGASGAVGPNLDTSIASRATIVSRVTNGKGLMQSYAGTLTPQQIQDVADFVVASRTG